MNKAADHTKSFTLDRLVLATHNKGKIAELETMLGPYVRQIDNAAALNLTEPAETGATFEENAILKARATVESTNSAALADDSGLCVYALDGDPGIYSARWAGPEKDFQAAMKAVHEKLGGNPDRRAAFVCVLALAFPDGQTRTFEGRVEGEIIWPPRGTQGFGYDPCFVPEGHERTFAEMTAAEKKELSHRGRALHCLVQNYMQ